MAEPRRDYTCEEIVSLASDYLEGAMTAAQMTAFELHLNFCDGCSSFVDQVRTTVRMAKDRPEEQIPNEIKAKLLSAFKEWRR